MKTKLAVLSALVLVPVMTANVLAQGYSAIDQSTYNSLVTTAIWHGEGATEGDLNIYGTGGTPHSGDTTSWYIPTVIPMSISQSNGVLTIADNGATLHSFIPPSSASIDSLAPITGFAIDLNSPQYLGGYSALINSVTVSVNGGAPVNIPLTLDTTSVQSQSLEVWLGQSVSTFNIGFNLNLPTDEATVGLASEIDVLGINQVPEPSSTVIAGLGAALFGLVRY